MISPAKIEVGKEYVAGRVSTVDGSFRPVLVGAGDHPCRVVVLQGEGNVLTSITAGVDKLMTFNLYEIDEAKAEYRRCLEQREKVLRKVGKGLGRGRLNELVTNL